MCSLLTAIVATARLVGTTINLLAELKDSPQEISNLQFEHKTLTTAIENLDRSISELDNESHLNPTFQEQVRVVVAETETTLQELHKTIETLQPVKGSGKRAVFATKCMYFLNKRVIKSIIARIQARRDALALILQVWSTYITPYPPEKP